MEKEANKTIGYGKGVRAGNFKLYKVKTGIDNSIFVSNLTRSWRVQIPSTTPMYAFIEMLYSDYIDGKTQGLEMLLANLINVSLTPRADYIYLINLITQLFANPSEVITAKDGTKHNLVDAVCNDIRWITENLVAERERAKEEEENSPEAEEQLKRDETFDSIKQQLDNPTNNPLDDK